MDLKTASIVIACDAAKVERIMENLLGNAVKHTPETRGSGCGSCSLSLWARGTSSGHPGAPIFTVEQMIASPPPTASRIGWPRRG